MDAGLGVSSLNYSKFTKNVSFLFILHARPAIVKYAVSMIAVHVTKETWNKEHSLFCAVVYLYKLRMSIVKHFYMNSFKSELENIVKVEF